jgi:hypothetical protein
MDIDTTLSDRGKRYGDFLGHATVTQNMKIAMIGSANWHRLAADQREALEMIAHKVGRILNGDPNYHDSWHDIVGYTKLVADRLAARDAANDDARAQLNVQESPPCATRSPSEIAKHFAPVLNGWTGR